jgi:hypothetical protein
LVTVGAVSLGLWPVVAMSATSSQAPSAIEGTWVTETTCEQQNAALARAGFSSADLELAGWDEATCGGMMHGSRIELLFSGDQLVIYQDDIEGWMGTFQVVDADTFAAGDPGNLYITYGYALDGDELSVDMIGNDYPAATPEELAGELVAQTVIYESAPFTRQLDTALPYSLALPEGWVAGAPDSFESPDGRVTLTIGTGEPEPGQTVEDRVRINRESEDFIDCVTDPSQDRPVTIGGEQGILWSFLCGDEAGLAANTIHDGLGYRLTLRAPADAAAELEPLMAELLAGFSFSD